MNTYNLSIYIPRVNNNITEEFVKQTFRSQQIGIVNRVDFVQIVSPAPGLSDGCQSAFVHFDGYYDSEETDNMYKAVFEEDSSWKFYPIPSSPEYWLLLKNKNPVQPTKLNIHQLAENHRILEEAAAIQSQHIQEQLNTINFIKYKYDIRLTRLEEEVLGLYEIIKELRSSKEDTNRVNDTEMNKMVDELCNE
jgi:hypothetical protein